MPVRPDPLSVAFAVVCALAVAVAAIVAVARAQKAPRIGLLAAGVVLVHAIVGITLSEQLEYLAPDVRLYDNLGQFAASYISGSSAQGPAFSVGKEGWVWILGGIYAGLGHMPEIGIVLNAAAMGLAVLVVADTTRLVGWPQASYRAAMLTGFAPILLFYGSLLLREALATLLVALIINAAARILGANATLGVVGLLASLAGLLWIRGTLAIILGAALFPALWLATRKSRGATSWGLASLGALLIAIGPLSSRLSLISAIDVDRINIVRSSLARGTSTTFGAVTDFSSPLDALTSMPRLFPRALLGPFPWEWSIGFAPLILDALMWWAVVYLGILGWQRARPREGRWLCVVPAIVLLAALAITSGNYGALSRHRALVLPSIIPLVAMATIRQGAASKESPQPESGIAEPPPADPSAPPAITPPTAAVAPRTWGLDGGASTAAGDTGE